VYIAMPKESKAERKLIASLAAHESWARTDDRTARTAPARAAMQQKFLDQAGGDPIKAEHLRKAHFARMQLKAAQARRRAREHAAEAERLAGVAETADAEFQAELQAAAGA
jgi:hypothetical protein